jgi:hypothetical protein
MFPPSREMLVRHPLRLSILAILEGLQGIMLLLGVWAVIVVANGSGTMTLEGYPIFRADASIGAGHLAGVFLLMGVLSLFFAWGLWKLRRWAYWATVIILLIGLTNSVIAFTQAPAHVAFILVGMISPVIMLLYLLIDANVRDAFHT